MTATTTNGASLEDCLTNIFSLIDLNGIRWKRFKQKEQNNFLFTPIDTHPILTTYAKCIEENHIAAWRHEPQKRHSIGVTGTTGGGTGSAGHSNFPTPTRTSNNNTPTSAGPLSGTTSGSGGNQNNNNSNNQGSNSNNGNNYELWIFGYGEQLKVDDVIGDDLVEIEDDNWEQKGLSYECRTLLFKALHNLIDRCLTGKGFTRIGRWFVQPSSEHFDHLSSQLRQLKHLKGKHSSSINPPTTPSSNIKPQNNSSNLSSSISTTINNFIDGIDSRRAFDKSNGLRHTSTRSCNTYFTTSLDGTKSSLSFSFSFFIHGNNTICTTVDVRQHPLIHPLTRADLATFQAGGIVRVALAPYGLNGILNGVNYKDSDNGAATAAFIQQWSKFYPLPKTLTRLVSSTKASSNNSAMASSSTSFQKTPTSTHNQFNQNNDAQGSRSYLSNLTNMLLPPTSKPSFSFDYEPHEVPPVVEVIVSGFRMRYPSECVFITSRIIDHYKSLQHLSSPTKPNQSSSVKRSNKGSPIKPNKFSLLSEKISEEKSPSARIKLEVSDQQNDSEQTNPSDNPFKTISSSNECYKMSDGLTSAPASVAPTIATSCVTSAPNTTLTSANISSQQQPDYINKDRTISSFTETETNSGITSNNSIAQTTISRFNSTNTTTKVSGFNSNNTPLGPTDLVKLFPTPPSLEQILSPSANGDESNATKELSATSPADQNFKDIGIDVYKPVECASMPPPPKWAALTNIVIASSRSLPPECIYKGSSIKTDRRDLANKLCDTINNNFALSLSYKNSNKQLSSLLDKSSRNSPAAVPSPLADQTNKNGFNINPSTPKSFNTPSSISMNPATNSSSIFSPQAPTPSSIINNNNNNNQVQSTPSPTLFSAYTLPHQRLFNNLNEVNSVQLNLLVADSPLGMFQDHNFENCTMCVCNMSIKGSPPDIIHHKSDFNNSWKHSINNNNDSINNSSTIGNELLNECTCGFSAITNRHYSHLSGLFLEDELEITNILYDPNEMIDQNKLFRKVRLSTYSDLSLNEEQKTIAKMLSNIEVPQSSTTAKVTTPTANSKISDETLKVGSGSVTKNEKPGVTEEKSSQISQNVLEETKLFVIDQLKQQCSTMIHSNSSLSKVLMIESFRNNRHLTSCINYYAQAPSSKVGSCNPFYKFLDDTNKCTTVKMFNRNPCSLKFSDYCELVKNIVTKLGNQSQQQQQQNSRLSNQLVKSYQGTAPSSNLSSIFLRMFGSNRQPLIGKSLDSHSNNRSSVFVQGLQALVLPTLSIDPKGTLHMLEQLVKDESKEALATLNKAILIFSSPIHDWQFITTPIPENNFDVANLLKLLQPSLDDAVGLQNKLYKEYVHLKQQNDYTSRDSPSGAPVRPPPPCQGPLTWKQFHHAAGRGAEDQCEPQPIPSLLVGYNVDKSHMGVSPFALKFWDKLLIEPYGPGHNMYYLVIAPDDSNLSGHIYAFFRELSNIYELLKLGKHIPIGSGIITAPENDENSTTIKDDGWFTKLGYDERDTAARSILTRIKRYASQLDANLAKSIVDFIEERQPPYDPLADRFDSSPSSGPQDNKVSLYSSTGSRTSHLPPSQLLSQQLLKPQLNRPTVTNVLGVTPNAPFASASIIGSSSQQSSSQQPQHMGVPESAFGSVGGTTYQSGLEPTPQPFDTQQINQNAIKSQILINLNQAHNSNEDNTHLEDEVYRQTGIVVYMIDPFSLPSTSQNLRTLATIGLMKCYNTLLEQLPENLRRITQLQLISLDSIIGHSRAMVNLSRLDQLKSVSMNVYSRCRRIMTNQITAKSLTGFGPAAALDQFLKTKAQDICVSRMFTPPFILAPMKDKQTELGESYGHLREKSSVMFCSYCITEDQRWLLASVTNDKGELSESTVININIVDRMKKPKNSVKRMALRKLMEFIVSVMSDWVTPWRLIIGKLGRVGHGELKEWANLMSKRSLLNYSRHLNDRCHQCQVIPATETVSILSACLVSLEPDSKLRIMPDQFTSDDRQASFNKCPLSTPEDASATHILVFPTSASIQPNLGNVEDPLVGSGLEDDLNFPLEDGIEDLGVEENMDDIFSACNDFGNVADQLISSHNDTMMSSSNLQMGSVSCGDSTSNQDETLQLLQQPLALGYYISTAKIGQMPNWFWSTVPHLRNSCPVFLKSALHIHMPYVQLSDDLLHSTNVQTRKGHQLDSHMTTDVLRYVLEGYNSLSWLALNPKSFDRQSCLPVHMQNLLQLYHLMESFS